MKLIQLSDVYVCAYSSVCGPFELAGPLGDEFDRGYEDMYCGRSTYEQAEQQLLDDAISLTLHKANMKSSEVDIGYGGDLMNQLSSSHYVMKNYPFAFVGVYGACSTSVLASIHAAMILQQSTLKKALSFTSSHNATAERQFRYPNEYGVQKPPSTTFTATGAGAILFCKEKKTIRVKSATIGRVVDFDFSNPNDMGSAMAPAAFDTIMRHFEMSQTSFDDYDLIATGDLSQIGLAILKDMFEYQDIDTQGKLIDCGCLLYDINRQEVFSGGSGCACSILVSLAHLFKQLELGQAKRIMIVATGALLSVTMLQQKASIPCIAHAIVYERVD